MCKFQITGTDRKQEKKNKDRNQWSKQKQNAGQTLWNRETVYEKQKQKIGCSKRVHIQEMAVIN